MKMNVSIQLYTLREETRRNFAGTLKEVAKIGYKGVEFAGYGGIAAKEMRNYLNSFGLKATGSHVAFEMLTRNLDEVIEYNLEIGNKYIICPWNEYKSKEDYFKAAELYNEIGRKCKYNGLMFGYHNHEHEFESFDGEYGLDIIYKNTDPQLVIAEIDTYWVYYAGINPVDYIRKYSGRCPLIHLKDMEAGEGKDFAEVGNGIMDIKAIISAAKDAGCEWFIVEQDDCKKPALESVKISHENLKNMNVI
jgi:sugar phosphate isomerase/epimerase